MQRFQLTLCFAILTGMLACSEDDLQVAQGVEIQRFQGRWFEIAKLPRATQTDCHGTKAYYQLDGAETLSVVHECRIGSMSGSLHTTRAAARIPDTDVPAKLSIDVGGFFGDYWILQVGEKYEYAVVGHPTRRYLWILSRTPKLDPALLQSVLERAKQQQFDIGALEYTEQVEE